MDTKEPTSPMQVPIPDTLDSLKEQVSVLQDHLVHSVEIQAFDRKTIAKLREEKEEDNAAFLTNLGIIEQQYKQELALLAAQAAKDKATISALTKQLAEQKAEEEDAEDDEEEEELSMEEMINELQPAIVFRGVHAAD